MVKSMSEVDIYMVQINLVRILARYLGGLLRDMLMRFTDFILVIPASNEAIGISP